MLEDLAKEVERFVLSSPHANINDYLQEVKCCLVDLTDATSREKLKLVWSLFVLVVFVNQLIITVHRHSQ